MDFINNTLPDNKTIDFNLYILDPLSVIIKLAIISNKPVGTKIYIDRNIIYLQEPGMFQAVCRYVLKTNKTDIQFLYNPIELACKIYLTKESVKTHPKIKELFQCAQNGISKLIETYKHCSIMRLCFNYFFAIISNYFVSLEENKFIDVLFRKDGMTPLYTQELITSLSKLWTPEKIKVILNLTTFLSSDENAEANVKSLETIIESIDKNVQQIIN